MNPAIGEITCPMTGEHCEVVRAKSGKYPYYYRGRKCGIVHGKAPEWQKWILENAKFDQPQANPYAIEQAKEHHAQQVEQEPPEDKATAKSGHWLDELL